MLELKNVTKTFGSFKALDDLTLTVPKGAVYGLVGPNGAGKSTAIRHLTGIYRPDCGTITIGGIGLAALVGVILNLVLPQEKSEQKKD
jgi:ABC-2 type transport system ATP-binding protein